MREVLAVGLGGCCGALARYGLSQLIARRVESGWPVATLVVNLLGCLLLGTVAAWLWSRQGASETTRVFLTVGLLGSFTTFSTFSLETWTLLRSGAWSQALLLAGLSVFLGVAALALGVELGRRCFG